MDDQIKLRIKSLAEETALDPFNGRKHDQYIELLRFNKDDNLDTLLLARKAKLQHFRLSGEEIADWLEDVFTISDEESRIGETVEFYEMVLKMYPTATYWANYLEFILSVQEVEISEDMIRGLFTRALKDAADDFKDSGLVWKLILEHLAKSINAEDIQSPDFRMVLALFKKRLSYPAMALDEAFSEFSSFISKYDEVNYVEHMREGTEIVNRTKKVQRYIEVHELELLKDNSASHLWIQYMENIHAHMDPAAAGPLLNNVFRRFLSQANKKRTSLQNPSKSNMQVWLTYIYCLYERKLQSDQDVLELTLLDFVLSYPESPISYSELIRSCHTSKVGHEIFQLTLKRWDAVKRIAEDDGNFHFSYDEWKVLAIAILHYRLGRFESERYDQDLTELYEDMKSFVDYAISKNHDVFHSVEKLAISICSKLGNFKLARTLLEDLLEAFPGQGDVWIYSIQFYKSQKLDHKDISKVYERAIKSIEDISGFEKTAEEWLQYEHVYGDAYSIRQAVVISNNQLKRIVALNATLEVEDEATHVQTSKFETPKKRKHSESDEPTSRSRENFTVLVSNIPVSSKSELEKFFKECGTIRNIILFHENQAILEFSSEQEVFTALTKNLKKWNGNAINVERKLESTIFVSNYPPSIKQEDMRSMFNECGEIVSLRFPTQRSNHTRRFCYLEFSSANQAKKAVVLFNGKNLIDNLTGREYELKVAISQPTKQANVNDRKVRLNNIPFSYKDEHIRELFKDCGSIEKLIIPSSHRQRSRNQFNDGFAFLTFDTIEATNKALDRNGVSVEGRAIEVSKQKIAHKDNFHDFNELCTVGLQNVDGTLTSQQIYVQLAQEFGPVNRIKLFPKESAALVEFERAADSGSATMKAKFALGSLNAEVKSKADIVALVNGAKPEPKKQKLMVPASVQRKRRK